MQSVYDLMTRALIEYFGIPAEDIRPDATFGELEIDSLTRVELVTMLEDELGVDLPAGRAGSTLAGAARHLERLAGGDAVEGGNATLAGVRG